MGQDDIDQQNIANLQAFYKETFNRLTTDEERTIDFYYHVGQTRGVDGHKYVSEAIKRASFKKDVEKPISYVASLCKNFYRNGLYAKPFQDENDIVNYIETRIGNISTDNKQTILSAISSKGSVRVMAAAAEILNNSKFQDEIVESIIIKVIEIFGREKVNGKRN